MKDGTTLVVVGIVFFQGLFLKVRVAVDGSYEILKLSQNSQIVCYVR